MAKLLKLRRGTTSQHNTFTGAEGEVTIDTTKDTAVVHDGSTTGGRPLAREDMSNVSSSAIAGRLGADAIATTKIAGGTLPSDVKVTDSNVSGNLTIVNADVTSSAAIAGTKISPNFGSQTIATTGKLDIGGSSGAAIEVPNNRRITLGNNGEFYLVHAANYSQIKETGSDNLYIDASHIHMRDANAQNKLQTGSSGITVSGNIAVTGTVDGRDVAADGSKLDGIESGATGDQTAAEIRTLVESASDSNVFTNADHTKLNGIESGATADQSASEILTAIKTVDGSGSGLDADTLDGAQPSDAASNSTIVKRNSSGYVFANFFNTSPNDIGAGSVTKICAESGNDGYIRHAGPAAVRSFINVENGATADQTGPEINSLLSNQNITCSGLDASNSVIRTDSWFYNDTSGNGLYNAATTQHFYSDHDDYWNIAGGGSANALRFRDDHGSTIRGYVYADNSNQIGFLNSSAAWSLKCDNSGNVTATGNVTAYSDARLKTNVNTINDALSIVGKLRGVSFDWKESGEHSIGVIAQEVEKVLPELVLTQQVLDPTGEKEVKSVDYGKIVGVLINAINELKAEVDELKGGK